MLSTSCTGLNGGYGPCDLGGAYGFGVASGPTWTSNGRTIAIVDAYDDPSAEADLAAYRSHYDLPPCTTANGCFRKVNQNGVAASYPVANSGWATEMSLDLDMSSVGCGRCRLLLVEARSNSLTDIGTAEQTAVSLGANAISNSFSTQGELGTTAYDGYFNHPGVAITASTGDNGYLGGWPSDIPTVIGVGGTSLSRSASAPRGWVETAWSGGGSWCSGYESEPAWQQGLVTTDLSGSVCINRTTADVSADADPNTGVAIYDTYSQPGWLEVGGTSVSSPLIASLYAAAGDALGQSTYPYPAKWTYAHASSLNDVTSGSNGTCYPVNTDPYYLCHAEAGYDGPTGLGTPNGLTGF